MKLTDVKKDELSYKLKQGRSFHLMPRRKPKIRIGMIARCDNGGLGIKTHAFCKWLTPDKTMVVIKSQYRQYAERYTGAIFVENGPTNSQLKEFLEDIDIFFTVETSYNLRAFDIARQKGVKSVMLINYEWLHDPLVSTPDLFLLPCDWYFDNVPEPKMIFNSPVDREVFKFRQRKVAKKFIHIAGHQSKHDRQGTNVLLEAIKHIKSDIELRIYSQMPLQNIINDSRVIYLSEVEHPKELYSDADVLVYPRRYAGNSLPMDEALSCGIPVLMTNMSPQNKFMPESWLIEADSFTTVKIRREVEYANIVPTCIAQKIDEFANKEITADSLTADSIAGRRSWKVQKPKLLEIFAKTAKKY